MTSEPGERRRRRAARVARRSWWSLLGDYWTPPPGSALQLAVALAGRVRHVRAATRAALSRLTVTASRGHQIGRTRPTAGADLVGAAQERGRELMQFSAEPLTLAVDGRACFAAWHRTVVVALCVAD